MASYQPLRTGNHQIRLTTIAAGRNDGPIQCSLNHEILGDEHTCLSYAWGDELPLREIYINGKPATVRQNLWNFLHTARRYKFSRKIWIDAICIDQANTSEKNHQVRLMSKIYSQAVSVNQHSHQGPFYNTHDNRRPSLSPFPLLSPPTTAGPLYANSIVANVSWQAKIEYKPLDSPSIH